jgi:BRCA1-associated RING domain protein 1
MSRRLHAEEISLLKASFRGDLRSVNKLLANGEDPNVCDKVGSSHDFEAICVTVKQHGWTPLHWASSKGYVEIVETLLQEKGSDEVDGVDPNAQDTLNGWTPLHLASIGGYVEVIQVLLENGASKAIRDKVTQKHWAYYVDVTCV